MLQPAKHVPPDSQLSAASELLHKQMASIQSRYGLQMMVSCARINAIRQVIDLSGAYMDEPTRERYWERMKPMLEAMIYSESESNSVNLGVLTAESDRLYEISGTACRVIAGAIKV